MNSLLTPASNTNIEETLEKKLKHLTQAIENSEVYRAIMLPGADPNLVAATLKHIYLSIAWYQPHVTEATFTAVGRMPKQSEQLIKTMILQQVEEVEHADMALRDFVRLGGSPDLARQPMSPACMAVAAMCHMLGEHTHPACYLGFMYIFEALTPVMASRVQQVMDTSAYQAEAREFVDLHAVEDIRHTDMVIQVIQDLCKIDPQASESVCLGFDYFSEVYPVPVWNEALERARYDLAAAG